MGFSLVIADVVEFPSKFTVNDGGKLREFKVTLLGDRVPQDTLAAEMKEADLSLGDFLARHLTGWRGQSLVIDDATGQPAEFSAGALAAMLSVTGVAGVVFTDYLQANAAKGKAGN